MWEIFVIYWILINFVTFIVYGIDKRRAIKHKWRISEFTLILLAVIGGSVGAYSAMKIFRHKTKHIKFYLGIPSIILLQICIVIWRIFLA